MPSIRCCRDVRLYSVELKRCPSNPNVVSSGNYFFENGHSGEERGGNRRCVSTVHRAARIQDVPHAIFFVCTWPKMFELCCSLVLLESHSILFMFHRTLLMHSCLHLFLHHVLHLHPVRRQPFHCSILRPVHPLPLCMKGCALTAKLNNP